MPSFVTIVTHQYFMRCMPQTAVVTGDCSDMTYGVAGVGILQKYNTIVKLGVSHNITVICTIIQKNVIHSGSFQRRQKHDQ